MTVDKLFATVDKNRIVFVTRVTEPAPRNNASTKRQEKAVTVFQQSASRKRIGLLWHEL